MEDPDFTSLSLQDRLSHKSWKARQSGYEELAKQFKGCEADDSILLDYYEFMEKALLDANQLALEAAVHAVFEFVSISPKATATRSKVVPTLIEKCLSSTRSGTRTKSMELLMLYVEVDDPVFATETLIGALDHKTPKVVAASVSGLKEMIAQFGIPTVAPKPILKYLPKLFDHKDKNVRSEASALTVEIYKWIGSAIQPSLADLKPVQLKELSSTFESIEPQAVSPARYLRSAQPSVAAAAESDNGASHAVKPSAPKVDAFDLADPVSFIEKLPKTFYTDLSSTKWKERKECLEGLLALVSFPKLMDGRYFELINPLAKVIPLAIERMKEKKSNVIQALRGVLDSSYDTIKNPSEVLEFIMTSLGHSNPCVKVEGINWLIRILNQDGGKNCLTKGEQKELAEKLIRTIDDSAAEVREAAALGLGHMIHVFSERAMNSYVERLEKVKHQKVMDAYATAKLGIPPSDAKSVKKITPPSSPVLKRNASTVSNVSTESKKGLTIAGALKTRAKVLLETLIQSSSASTINSKSSIESKREAKSSSDTKREEHTIRHEFTDESAREYCENALGLESLKGLTDSGWKVRLETMHSLSEKIKADPQLKVEALVRFLSQTPGWKENNFQVMVALCNTIQSLISAERGFNWSCGILIAGALFEKLGDIKVKKIASSCLDKLVETASVEVVFCEGYSAIKKLKSPKIISDCILWMNQCVQEFGLAGVNIKSLISFTKEYLASSAAPVRTQTVSFLGTIRLHGGPSIRNYLDDANPTMLQAIDAEFEKVSAKAPPIITRKTSAPATTSAKAPALSDLGSLISAETMNLLTASNWKERKEALESIATAVKSCHEGIEPNLDSDFISTLKARIADSNRNLACIAVEITGEIAEKVGKPFERYSRTLVPPMLSLLSDQKANVRMAAMRGFDRTVKSTSASSALSTLNTFLLGEQPQIRKELLKWTVDHSEELIREQIDWATMVPPILACLLDKNGDVRRLAQQVLSTLSSNLSQDAIRRQASDLYSGIQYSSICGFLDTLTGSSQSGPQKTTSVSSNAPATETKNVPKGRQIAKAVSRSNLKKETTVEVKDEEPTGVSGPIFSDDTKAKESRTQADRGLLKWTFEQPRRELVDHLSEQCAAQLHPDLHSLLFSTDHYKERDYVAGLKMIDSFLSDNTGLDRAEVLSRVVANCDLILKYLTLRFFDSNTSILIKSLELLEHLFGALDEIGYSLSEYEASSFLPFFISKLGDPKETLRAKLRGILKQISRVYPVSKLMQYLLKGLESKNAKTRTECLDEISVIIQRNGISVVSTKNIPILSFHVGDRDASVRNAALSVMCQIYLSIGEDIHKYLRKLGDKERDMILERIKRIPTQNVAAQAPKIKTESVTVQSTAPSVAEMDNSSSSSLLTLSADIPADVPKQFSLDIDTLFGPSKIETAKAVPKSPSTKLNRPQNLEDRLDIRLDLIIEQLSDDDPSQVLEAIRHLEKLLTAHPNHEPLRLRDLVGIIAPRLNDAFTLLSDDTASVRVCKHLSSILVQIVSTKDSAAYVPPESSLVCIRYTLLRLVDPGIQAFDVNKSLSRALNMLMVRIIDNCHPNSTFKALLSILCESAMEDVSGNPESVSFQEKFIELVMKCIWKITKMIPAFIDSKVLIVEDLLLNIHEFLVTAPPNYWKARSITSTQKQSDLPLRTVKTILHELVNKMGDTTMEYSIAIPEGHTMQYITQMLNNYHRKTSSGVSTPSKSKRDAVIVKSPEQSVVSLLDEIFTLITDTNNSKLGLKRLYDLKKERPEIDSLIEDRLSQAGSYFQGYVRRALSSYAEQEAPKKVETAPLSQASNDAYYKQTLSQLQRRFNFSEESSAKGTSKTDFALSRHLSTLSPKKPTAPIEAPPLDSQPVHPPNENKTHRSTTVQELKERLARMKMSMAQSGS